MDFQSFINDMTNTIRGFSSLSSSSVLYPNPDFMTDDYPDSGSVQMCVYYINKQCLKPFVKFAIRVDNDKIAHLPVLENLDNNFETSCDKLLSTLFTNKIQFTNDLYRGYIICGGMTFVFIDVSSHNHNLSHNYKYLIATELAGTSKSIWTPDEKIQTLFQDKDNNDDKGFSITKPVYPKHGGTYEYIEAPYIGYLCMISMKNNKETFISLTEAEQNKIYIPIEALINPKDVGHYYYFSDTIIEPLENDLYVRYAVFPMYSMNTDSTFPVKQKKPTDEHNSVVYYLNKKHDIKLCGVKSPDQFVAL